MAAALWASLEGVLAEKVQDPDIKYPKVHLPGAAAAVFVGFVVAVLGILICFLVMVPRPSVSYETYDLTAAETLVVPDGCEGWKDKTIYGPEGTLAALWPGQVNIWVREPILPEDLDRMITNTTCARPKNYATYSVVNGLETIPPGTESRCWHNNATYETSPFILVGVGALSTRCAQLASSVEERMALLSEGRNDLMMVGRECQFSPHNFTMTLFVRWPFATERPYVSVTYTIWYDVDAATAAKFGSGCLEQDAQGRCTWSCLQLNPALYPSDWWCKRGIYTNCISGGVCPRVKGCGSGFSSCLYEPASAQKDCSGVNASDAVCRAFAGNISTLFREAMVLDPFAWNGDRNRMQSSVPGRRSFRAPSGDLNVAARRQAVATYADQKLFRMECERHTPASFIFRAQYILSNAMLLVNIAMGPIFLKYMYRLLCFLMQMLDGWRKAGKEAAQDVGRNIRASMRREEIPESPALSAEGSVKIVVPDAVQDKPAPMGEPSVKSRSNSPVPDGSNAPLCSPGQPRSNSRTRKALDEQPLQGDVSVPRSLSPRPDRLPIPSVLVLTGPYAEVTWKTTSEGDDKI